MWCIGLAEVHWIIQLDPNQGNLVRKECEIRIHDKPLLMRWLLDDDQV
jgi:hypothetical protein